MKVAKKEGEFDPTLFATVIVNKEKVVKEKVDWRRPLPYNEKLRRAKTDEERQALAVAQVGVKEALKGRFRKSVVEYPHRCVEAARPRPILDLAVVKGAMLVSNGRNYAVVMGSLEQSLAGWASKTGGTLALAPHNIHVSEGGREEGRDTYTTRRRNHIGHLTLNLTRIGAGHGSFSSSDGPLSPSDTRSPPATKERRRRSSSQSSSPSRFDSCSSPPLRLRSLSPSSRLQPSPAKSSHDCKSQKFEHKPHNSLGTYKIPKRGSAAPANNELPEDVATIKKEPIDFEAEKEYGKPDEHVWVKEEKEETGHEVNEELVDDLLEESKAEEKELFMKGEEELNKDKEEEEELVKELLEESVENDNKEEDEFGFLDDLMVDLKEGCPVNRGEEEHQQNEEELQNNLLLDNL